ncbi:MAG TPA: hypothetical protein PK926_14390 [Spirochaetota bacterium]|nr:hypothetical protein [Spirochaetota bacterium]HPI91188.1 hypothetical protein [Spirochaetota bacterium]HPR49476.1 hypothetical protein [Spirochaetota bacterium]
MKHLQFIVMILLASLLSFCACDDGSDEKSENYYVKVTMDGTEYTFTRGLSDAGDENVAFGNSYNSGASTVIIGTEDGPAQEDIEVGDYLYMRVDGATAAIFTEPYISLYIDSESWKDSGTSGSYVTFTEYGEVGGVISGTFNGTVTHDSDTQSVSGSFRLKRIEDDTVAPK